MFIYMYVCWILIVPQDPFLYRNPVVYVFGDVTRSAGHQSLHQAREILLLVDFAILMAQFLVETGMDMLSLRVWLVGPVQKSSNVVAFGFIILIFNF